MLWPVLKLSGTTQLNRLMSLTASAATCDGKNVFWNAAVFGLANVGANSSPNGLVFTETGVNRMLVALTFCRWNSRSIHGGVMNSLIRIWPVGCDSPMLP